MEEYFASEDFEELVQEAFEKADADNSGALDREEIFELVKDLVNELKKEGGAPADFEPTQEDADQCLRELGKDPSDELNVEEFKVFMRMMLRGLLSEALGDMTLEESEEVTNYFESEEFKDTVREAFKSADEDGNGTLDKDEVYDLFCKISHDLKDAGGEEFHVTREEVEEAMKELDCNSDGVLDMDEFTTFMQSFFLSMAMAGN